MSAELALEDVDILELFDEDGELPLVELDDDWAGFTLEDGSIFYVDTVVGHQLRVGERAVRLAVHSQLDELSAEQRALACLAYLRDPTGTEQVVVGP